jgi:hypothetical protein
MCRFSFSLSILASSARRRMCGAQWALNFVPATPVSLFSSSISRRSFGVISIQHTGAWALALGPWHSPLSSWPLAIGIWLTAPGTCTRHLCRHTPCSAYSAQHLHPRATVRVHALAPASDLHLRLVVEVAFRARPRTFSPPPPPLVPIIPPL